MVFKAKVHGVSRAMYPLNAFQVAAIGTWDDSDARVSAHLVVTVPEDLARSIRVDDDVTIMVLPAEPAV